MKARGRDSEHSGASSNDDNDDCCLDDAATVLVKSARLIRRSDALHSVAHLPQIGS
jgi:hypothetical protein